MTMTTLQAKRRGKVVALRVPQGGFEAGQRGRRLKAIPTSTIAINSTIRTFGRTALARSRHLCVNNPFMVQAKEEFIADIVGEGIKPSFVPKDAAAKTEIQDLWLEWSDESDADGLTDFYGQQAIAAGEMFEAGEMFVRLRPRFISDGLSVPFQLQLLPSEMVPFDWNYPLPNGRRVECGIQFDAIGRREGYWFFRNHPGEAIFNWQNLADYLYFVPAEQVLHLFKPIRAGQIRGVPHTLAGIVTAALLDLYDDAELERKRTAALFTAFITRNSNEEDGENPLSGAPTSTPNSATNQTATGMEPGATVELTPGQNVTFADPADVGGNYEAFQYRNLLRTAAGLGLPYAQMTGDLRQASYGSQRAGLISRKRRASMIQNSVMVYQFCRPVVNAWLKAAVLANSFATFTPSDYESNPRGYGQRVRWIPPKWDWIDPLKDLTAEKLAVDSGFKARSDVIEERGFDAEEVDNLISEDQKRAGRLGLKFVTLRTGVDVSPTDDDGNINSLNGPPDSAVPADPNALPVEPKKAKPAPAKAATPEWPPVELPDRSPVNLTVNVGGRTVTRVTKQDKRGRILEFEQVQVKEDENG